MQYGTNMMRLSCISLFYYSHLGQSSVMALFLLPPEHVSELYYCLVSMYSITVCL